VAVINQKIVQIEKISSGFCESYPLFFVAQIAHTTQVMMRFSQNT
jgi:hypothetical protein